METTCIITNTAKLLVFDKYKIIHTARKIKKDFHMLFINIYELSVFQKYWHMQKKEEEKILFALKRCNELL